MGILRNVLSSTTSENIAKLIRGSTRLDTNLSTYFYRTPSSAGNQRQWTISLWVKNTNNYEEQVAHTSNYTINSAGTWSPGNQLDGWDLSTSETTHNVKDSLHWSGGVYGVSTAYNYGSYQSCRDISGWYNFVISVDTQATDAAVRCRTWTNGVENELKRTGSYNTISQDRDTMWNKDSIQYLFAVGGPDGFMDGYVCELYQWDGCPVQDANDFGFFDPETGIWRPKQVNLFGITPKAIAAGSDTGSGQEPMYLPLRNGISQGTGGTFSTTLTNNNGVTFGDPGANPFGIDRCSIFSNASSQSITSSADYNQTNIYTIDFFCKFDNLDSEQYITDLCGGTFGVRDNGGTVYYCCHTQSSATNTTYGGIAYMSAADTNWHHVRIQGGTQNGIWVDGTQQTISGASGGTYPRSLGIYSATTTIGGGSDASNYLDGKIANLRVLCGIELGAPPAGGLQLKEANGWGTDSLKLNILDSGTNGFYLPLDGTGSSAFQDSSNYGEDQSGKNNDWTKSGTMYFTSDSPSGVSLGVNNTSGITTTNFPSNYCVWDSNSCANEPMSTVADGATKIAYNSAAWRKIRGSLPMKAGGKYYFEVYTDTNGSIVQGICNSDCDFTASGQHAGQSNYSGYGIYNNGTAGDAEIVNYSSSTSSVWAVSDAQWLGVALDLSANTTTGGKLYFYKNGTMLNSAAAWPGGPGQDIDCTRDWWPAVSVYNTGSGGLFSNFGATPFNYLPPDGFLPVCTSNYQPAFSTPSQHVGIVTYTGNALPRQIDMDFRTDMVWIKSRGNNYNWRVWDSVRGMKGETDKALYLDTTDVEGSLGNDGALTANPGGFNITTNGDRINENTDMFVSYSWKAGGNENTFNIDGTGFSTFAATGITAGTITPTGMSVGKDSGFSIVQYTGNDTAGATVPHGLGAKPAFMIIRCVNNGDDWLVYHKSEGATKYGYMNTTGAFGTATTAFNDTEPTDNVFSLGTSADGNSSSYNYIAYVWAEKSGLSCFTKYKGNGQVLGPEIPMGFLPALTIVKNSSNGSEWSVIDRVRNRYNLANTWISTSANAGDATPGYYRDLNSNGMKIRDNGSGVNTDNQDYIVMAWALHPINATQGAQSTGG